MDNVIRSDIETIISGQLPWEDLDNKTVLVTGATGMVGYYVTAVLLSLRERRGIDVSVVALVRSAEKAVAKFEGLDTTGLSILEQDVSSSIEPKETVDMIIHAASPASPDKFGSDPVGVVRANIEGSFNTLELARKDQAKFCFISTMEVYGQVEGGEDDIILHESDNGVVDNLSLRAAYPESKRAAETLAVAYGSQYDVDYKIARMTHTYGPGMDINDTRVQTEFMRRALAGDDIVLKTDGSLRRTYTYVADAIAGVFYVLLAHSDERVFNIANEKERLSIRDLAEAVAGASDGKTNVVVDVDEAAAHTWSKTRNTFVDCTRLRSLGWSAHVDVAEGMRRTLLHHRSE